MKTAEEMAEEYCKEHDECEFARDAFLAGYKAGFELGCMKGAIAMQWTLDSDYHLTPLVNYDKLAKVLTKKELTNK